MAEAAEDPQHNDQQHNEIAGADDQQHNEIAGADDQQHTEMVMGATSEPTSIFFQNTLLDQCGDQVCIRS